MLQSIWVHTQDSPHEWRYYLIDPDNYRDCETNSEMAWRVTTGKSHAQYCVAHAKALRDVATRLLEALKPAPHLALPAPRPQPQAQPHEPQPHEPQPHEPQPHEPRRNEPKAKPKRKSAPEVACSLGMNYELMILNPRYERDGVGRACVTIAGDHEYIEAMFRIYSEGRTRLLI
jgi:hypothetical protein